MAGQGEPAAEPWLAAAGQASAPPAAGGGKRPIALVTREELRDLNREKRRKQAEERRGKLLETFKQAKEVAEEEDGWLDRVKDAPIYTPTATEWADPLAYIRNIAPKAGRYGMCIVRAPVVPSVPGGMALQLSDPTFKFGTRQQALRDRPWKDWQGVTFLPGKRYSLKEFQDAACAAAAKRFGGLHGCLPTRTLEREYWREREKAAGAPLLVEYGSDVDGSLFTEEDRLGATRWNLNTLPSEPGSALRHCDDRGNIPGVTRPMLYCGQLFSTFAWHVEDHFMFSINYQHLGSPKLWYGVPASDADSFEAVARQQAYGPAAEQTQQEGGSEEEVWVHVERALMGKTTMLSPRHLLDAGVQVFRAVQQPGDFVLTFPRSYHAGFGCGFQVGEAVNFAMDEWWPFGEDARQRYRRMRQPAIIPHEQLLCEEALALAAKQRRASNARAAEAAAQGGGRQGRAPSVLAALRHEMELEWKAPGNALAFTFVGAMRRLNHCRAALEAGGAVPLSACPADSPAARQSLHCCVCRQSVYAASAVLQPAGQPDSWRHMCLECATAAAQTAAAPPAAVVFVKPCWEELEACAQELEPGLQDPAATLLALPLAGTTAEERYGPCDPPGWPSPCQPYSWRPLQQPHTEWPAAVLRLLAPAAGGSAPAVPTPDAVALAGVAAAGAAVTPEAAFQVALKHEAEQAAAAAAAADPGDAPADAAADGAAAAAAAAAAPAAAGGKRSRGRRRGRGQPADEDDADALEALPLESEAAIEVEGHPVQRHIHSDGGEPVLVGSEALEAVLGSARDKKESAAKKLGSWLRKCGSGVSKAKLAGPGRHQAVALLRRQDAAALLGSEELDQERWERLRLFVEGVWPDLDAQLAAGTLSRTGGARGLERQTSAGGKPAARRRGSGQSGGAGSTGAAAAPGLGEEEAEISEDTPLSALTGEEQQQGGEAGAEIAQAMGATSEGRWEPASKRRRASTTLAGPAELGAVAGLKREHPVAAVHASPGNGAPAAHQQPVQQQQQQQQQQQPAAQQGAQPGQQAVPALSVEDAAQMLAAAGPELLAAIMQQGVSLEDPAVINAVVAHLERALQ